MPRFAANIDWMFTELPFLQRFEAAAECGFKGVEFMFPYSYRAGDIRSLLDQFGLELVMFNVSAGDWKAGERGIASHPLREEEFRAAMAQALEYATALHTKRLNVLAGLKLKDVPEAVQQARYVENLRTSAAEADRRGVTLLVEAINQVDMPGYFVRAVEQAAVICAETTCANVAIQMDLYHCQMSEGRLADTLEKFFDRYRHVQVAGVPGRHEPDQGEVNYPYLFDLLDELGYDGWVGCEYKPLHGTADGLRWLGRPFTAITGVQIPSGTPIKNQQHTISFAETS